MKHIKQNITLVLVAIFAVLGLSQISVPMVAGFSYTDCPVGSLWYKDSEKAQKDTAGRAKVDSIAKCNMAELDDGGNNSNNLFSSVNSIINLVLASLGAVAVLVIVIGGFQYLTSAGDPGKTTKARNTILYGIIGLVVALLSFAVVNFVLNSIK